MKKLIGIVSGSVLATVSAFAATTGGKVAVALAGQKTTEASMLTPQTVMIGAVVVIAAYYVLNK